MVPGGGSRLLGMGDDAVQVVVGNGARPQNRPPLPNWVVVLAVVIGVGGLLVFIFMDRDSIESVARSTSSTTSSTVTAPPVIEAGPTTSALHSPTTTAAPARRVVPTVDPGDYRGLQPRGLQGDVALVPRPGPVVQSRSRIWVFREGGSVVQREDLPLLWPVDGSSSPILLTGGHVIFSDGRGGYIVDVGLMSEPSGIIWAAVTVVLGAGPNFVWFTGSNTFPSRDTDWVALFDVESGSLGETIDVTGQFRAAVVGISEGLIVEPVDTDVYGRYAYWSPTDGMRQLVLPHIAEAEPMFVLAASDDLVAVIVPGELLVLNISNGDLLTTFSVAAEPHDITAVCISPDQQHLVVVTSRGDAFIGRLIDGEIVTLLSDVQGPNGVGWTSNDQVVFISTEEGTLSLEGYDIATSERNRFASLEGSDVWWLAASGAMC